jgi:Tol biopolymer transport system component
VVYATWDDTQLGTCELPRLIVRQSESWIVTDQPGHYVNPVFSPDGQTLFSKSVEAGNCVHSFGRVTLAFM